MPPTTFGMLMVWYLGLPGSTRSGEKHRKKSLAHLQSGLLEHGQQQFVGGTGIGCGFQNQQHAGMEVLRDFLARGDDIAHVRIFGLAQRRWHADVDRVQFATAEKSVVARSLPARTISDSTLLEISPTYDSPAFTLFVFSACRSMPVTWKPALANSTARGRPT